jgi:diguanylate cyclase (GGDEF)-like protein
MFDFLRFRYDFTAQEALLTFKFNMLRIGLILIVVFSPIFMLFHVSGIRIITLPSFYSLLLLWVVGIISLYLILRSKKHYKSISYILVLCSLGAFILALFDIGDGFRAIWIFLVMVMAYAIYGIKLGMITYVLSMGVFLTLKLFFDLQYKSLEMITILGSFTILAQILYYYTKQIHDFEKKILDQNKILELIASHDSLTGIMNRRVFLEMAGKYLSKAKREERGFYFLMLDLDNFKMINDNHGHQYGDKVLIEYSKLIESLLRDNDLFGRLGGEEFGIAVLDDKLEGVQTLAEKIRREVESYGFYVGKKRIYVTVSIGIAGNSPDFILDNTMHEADVNMYRAKKAGRNRVCTSSEPV